MKKLTKIITLFLCCGIMTSANVYAVSVEKFTHQNIAGNQTCYSGDDLLEKDIADLPEVVMGMRINNPVIRAYLKNDTEKTVNVKAEQYSKYGRLLKTDEFENVEVSSEGTPVEFKRVRNAVSVKLYVDNEYIGGINDDEALHYKDGILFSDIPADYQIYQRNAENKAEIKFAGKISEWSEDKTSDNENIIINDDNVVVNFKEKDKNAVVFAAGYDGDNNLQDVKLINKAADKNSVTIDNIGEYNLEKIMVWESIDSMKPIYDAVSIAFPNNIAIKAENKATSETTVKMIRADEETLAFNADITLDSGLYDISVIHSGKKNIIKDVGVGDIWVAAGQSNMTDMGAVTDGFDPDKDDPVTDNMHIIFAESAKWQKMSHPAGEGRFFKSGVRTSPVTSFARIISEDQGVPVGIVQSSVGGTNIWQWAKGIKSGDAADGYLLDALKSCFDNMPSHDIKGILWYQGCNDTMTDIYAYDYENLQRTIFTQMREFFGESTPVITTQINDAKQADEASSGYYDAWSYVKDVQRRNPELYDNVYVVGTNALDLGDTIHNSAASNVIVGGEWAAAALNCIYGKTDVTYLHPTVSTVKIADEHTINIEFKNVGADGLFVRDDKKRLGITNGLHEIQLGDLKQEFIVRQGGGKTLASSNTNKGTALNITDAVLQEDGKTVTLTVAEELAGVVAVDCCYGKYFVPSLTDKATGWSVLSFFNVIADWGENIEKAEPTVYSAADTALISEGDITVEGFPQTLSENITKDTASDKYMYLNKYQAGNAYPLMKFNLKDLDTSHIQSAKLKIYTNEINKDRNGNISVRTDPTGWDNTLTYSKYAEKSASGKTVKTYENVNTASVFPVKAYSDIDITDYISSLENPENIAFVVDATHTAVALMSGVNSENPPQIVVQPGRIVKLSYKDAADMPVSGLKVTVSGVRSTEYNAKEFVTDENGEITVVLTEGNYKAVTEQGKYLAAENRFSVSEDSSQAYKLETNNQIPKKVEIGGGSETAMAGTNTSPFTAVVYDTEDKIINGAEFTWECEGNASVKDGVVTILENAADGEIIKVKVTAVFNGVSVSAEKTISVIEINGFGFGTEYIMVKDFNDTSNADNVRVGNSGLTASSSGGNYNGIYIRNSKSQNVGYWPYTSSFKADNDVYYLFIGAGGSNDNETVTLKLPKVVKAGRTITIKMAKPRATQKAGVDRTSGNSVLTVTVGSQVIDLQNNYNFDEWKTENIVSSSDVQEIEFKLGKWSAAAIESISIDGAEIPVITPPPATPEPQKVKIMPLGDSITNGFSVAGAYRNRLCELLVTNNLSDNVDFVGSQNTGSGYDNDNEGHSGWAIAKIPQSGDVENKGRNGLNENIDSWMNTYKPDIVLLQVGTNDILSLYDLGNAPQRLETLVDKVLAKLPSDGKMYIAKIPYISESANYNKTGKNQAELNEIVDTYNMAVVSLAQKKGITLVDINGCITLSDLQDGIHPNAAGYAKMGELWYSILEDEIKARISE